MAQDVRALVRQAAEVLSEALDEAAAIALIATERYGATLQAFCKQVADEAGMPGAWEALRQRTYRLQKQRAEGAEYRSNRTQEVYLRTAKRIVADPETAASIPHGDKVAFARSLLSDKEVAEDVMRDDRTRRQASMAVSSAAQETVRESVARDRQRYPQDTADRDVLTALSFVNDANERVKAALRVLREGGELDKDGRAAIMEAVERLEASTGFLRDLAQSPHKNIDEALDALLGRG